MACFVAGAGTFSSNCLQRVANWVSLKKIRHKVVRGQQRQGNAELRNNTASELLPAVRRMAIVGPPFWMEWKEKTHARQDGFGGL